MEKKTYDLTITLKCDEILKILAEEYEKDVDISQKDVTQVLAKKFMEKTKKELPTQIMKFFENVNEI